MKGIGGNIQAKIQTAVTTTNAIGEQVKTWSDAQTLTGWLDLSSGDSKYRVFNAKIEQSTHIFICDYVALNSGISAETTRMIINTEVYDILYIDNPMGLGAGSQLEFYLRHTGG